MAEKETGLWQRARPWLRRLCVIACVTILAVLILLLFMPLYSTLFAPVVAGQLGRALGLPVRLAGLRADLLGGTVELKGLNVREADSRTEALVVDRAYAECRLGALLRGEIEVPRLALDGFRLLISADADGNLNWQPVLDRPGGGQGKEPDSSGAPPVRVNVELARGEIVGANAAGLRAGVSALKGTVRINGLQDIRHELAGRVDVRRNGPAPVSADGQLSLHGSARVTGGKGVSASGVLALQKLRFEGLADGSVADRHLDVSYDVAADPAGGRVAVPAFQAASDYFDLTVADLNLSVPGPALARVPLAAAPTEGRVEGLVLLDRVARDFGPRVARLSGGMLRNFGGTLQVAASVKTGADGSLSLDEEFSLSRFTAAGSGEGGDYSLAPADLAQEGTFSFSSSGAGYRGSLRVVGEASDPILAMSTALSSSREPEDAKGVLRWLSNELSADLEALDRTFGALACATGLVPAGVGARGRLSHRIEATLISNGWVEVSGGGQIDETEVALPDRVFAPGAVELAHNGRVHLEDGKVTAVELSGDDGARIALDGPGLTLSVGGRVDGMAGPLDSWRLGALRLTAEAQTAALAAWLERARIGTAGPSADGVAGLTLAADGPVEDFGLDTHASYAGEVNASHGADAEPVGGHVEFDLSPALQVRGLPGFLRDPHRTVLQVQGRSGNESRPDLRVQSKGDLLCEGWLDGGVSLAGGALDVADSSLRLVVQPGPLRRAVGRWVPENMLRISENLFLGGTAEISLQAVGNAGLKVGLDLTPTELGLEGIEGRPILAKQPATPLSVAFTAKRQADGITFHPVEFDLAGLSGTTGLAVGVDGKLSGPGEGGAYVDIPEFALGSLGRVLPGLESLGLGDATLALGAHGLRSGPGGKGEIRASIDVPTLSLPELRRELSGLAPAESPDETPESESAPVPAVAEPLDPGLRERLRSMSAQIRYNVGRLELGEARRLDNVRGAVLFNRGGADNRLAVSAVLEPVISYASAGRVRLTCEGSLDEPPFDALDFTGRFLDGPLRGGRVSGWCEGLAVGRPSVQARFDVPRLDIGEPLLALVPESARPLLEPYSMDGTVSLSGFATHTPDAGLRYSADVELSDVRLKSDQPPLTVHGLSAAVHVDEKRVQCRHFVGRAWGGQVKGTLLAKLPTRADTGATFECRFDMENASLQQLGSQLGGKAAELSGLMSGTVDARGTVTDPRSIVGRGTFGIQEARLAQLPVITGLFNVLSLSLPEKTVFDSVELTAQAERGEVRFPSIVLSSRTVDVTGKGSISVQGDCNLVMGVATSQRPRKGIPLLSDALTFAMRGIQRTVLPPVRVTGKLWDPSYRPMLMDPIRRPLASVTGLIPLLPDPQSQEQAGESEAGVRSFGAW